MSSSPQIQARTGLFARILGPYLIVAALTMVANVLLNMDEAITKQ